MEDAKYINKCSHHIICKPITIEKVVGRTGIYTATLDYPAITSKALVFIRNYNDEKSYMYNGVPYTETLNCAQVTATGSIEELPKSSIVKNIGITNFNFINDTTIIFGEDETDTTIRRIDLTNGKVPKPIFLIDYYAKSEKCPICNGTGIVQDLSFNGAGSVLTSSGHQKLVQTVVKALVTTNGESAEDAEYGSSLDSIIGYELDLTSSVAIQKCVNDSLKYVMELQSGKDLDPEELLTGVASIKVEQDTTDPSIMNIIVKVLDGNAEEVSCIVSMGVN